ncbi:hypothetical protein PNA2_1900 [Pyrococcus sp. NA2]|uniref:transglutaminase-like domain-containing protein n=1 Tax=Pyrococcus sp. (strain NA2) TaxID=342949 RepID=UPI000209AD00|nr:transglutaminase-like domain-containing protein [Pyrococcus sp. NA2]AEC52814.1 hypothetical protein PNA2_1900 [Pyrococcus sp. NA2]
MSSEHKRILLQCAKELEDVLPDIADRVREIASIESLDAMFLEYLRIVEDVSLRKIERTRRNRALIILWRYGEALERMVYSDVKFFARPIKGKFFKLIDWKIVGMLLIVFIILPSLTSSLWSFKFDNYVVHSGEEINFYRQLCNYRVAWLYDFRGAMVCVLKYGYGTVNITLHSNDIWGKAIEAQGIISKMGYDFSRLKTRVTYIQTPIETIMYKKGVCSDFALLVANLLLYNNVSPVYIVHTVFKGDISGGHAAAAIYVNGTLWILDWGSRPTKFSEYVDNLDKMWEIQEIRIYRITRKKIILDRVYKARFHDDRWRFAYMLFLLVGVFWIKRREWWLI